MLQIPMAVMALLCPLGLAIVFILAIELVAVRPSEREEALKRQRPRDAEASRAGGLKYGHRSIRISQDGD